MNKDYTNKDGLKQQSNKSQDASKINQDKNKQQVPPSSSPNSPQSTNR